jgi:beta-galactosidase
MILGVQYYRPPFPDGKYWEEDFARIKDSGLDAVQLWVLWGWVEATPGAFRFDDYDRLVELAAKHNLGVVLSTIAEIQPYWIHKLVPGSEMIDHMGRKVVSSNRGECHFGMTPGGCTDHPGVWERMQRFLTAVVTRYRSAEHLRGWDAWSELRWNVNADGLVCFCEHTLAAYRGWLSERFGGLEGLNEAWKRRYSDWDEVMPGKLPDRPYTDMMAFEHFITWCANQHGAARYNLIKALDPSRAVTVHAATPSPLMPGNNENHAVNRGNDWVFADAMDGVGCSSFPKWQGMDDADFGMRVEFVKSAARDKLVWLSEVQGGRSAVGYNVYQPVDALSQQRWIWNGVACGADMILFWCWRDEVFGRESGGFGLIGDDGLAEERVAAMRKTGALLREHADLLEGYRPAQSQVGVLFSPQTYYLNWAQEMNASHSMQALLGYTRSLVKRSIPYQVVEEEHLDALEGLRVLFMPRTWVVDAAMEATLTRWVQQGGMLVCESECGAFDSRGFYRYPADRFTARLSGSCEVGRRTLEADTIAVTLQDEMLNLGVTQWITPWQRGVGQPWAEAKDGHLVVEVPVGKGRLILCGAYLGDAYLKSWNRDFERFVELIARRAGWQPDIEVLAPMPREKSFVYVKGGTSQGKNIAFVFFPEDCQGTIVGFRPGYWVGKSARDLVTGQVISVAHMDEGQICALRSPECKYMVLVDA